MSPDALELFARASDRLRRPVWLYDPRTSRGVYANPAALALWGAETLDELLARDFSILSPAVKVRTDRLVELTAEGDEVSERWTFYPNGQPFTVEATISAFRMSDGRDILLFEGCEEAWTRALRNAGVTLDDLSFVETHDCFTIAELIEYEAMGLAKRGEGAKIALEGQTAKDGRLPVNPSGGLKAKGHPIGATGVSMHALTAMQLAGEAGGIQVPGAKLGGIFNMGGAAVANYVSILERIK